MFKKIYLLILVVFSCVLFSSCSQDKWETAPTVMVDTYKISGFSTKVVGTDYSSTPLYMSVYRTKSSVVTMGASQTAKIATMIAYTDASTDTEYAFSYTVKLKDKEYHYNYSGSRVTGLVTLEVTEGENVTTYSNLAVAEVPETSTGENNGISEVQDKSFRAISNAIFISNDDATCILLHANTSYNKTVNEDFDPLSTSVMVNGVNVPVESAGINVGNNSVLNIKLSQAVTADDVVSISYNGKGKVKSEEGRDMLPFDANVKFIK